LITLVFGKIGFFAEFFMGQKISQSIKSAQASNYLMGKIISPNCCGGAAVRRSPFDGK
jgi:hypothetical protein